ncbi:MAG: hypothetical protein N3A68_02990 [Bacteroidia bacterium]|jgi:hypothetical protein|nr:hypothetical protein [Bacteroidia bacterium]GIV23097.1 MAG: hypothetical protein KatS3mg025_0756 [Bacteroidia bacterium]
MRYLLSLISGVSLYAQGSVSVYLGSEFMLLRFHRGYVPPVLASGAVLGGTYAIVRSGVSHTVQAWGEGRVAYIIGGALPPIFGGGSAGVAWRLGLPDPTRYYAQAAVGIDAYALRVSDKGGTPLRDTQIRPILSIEVGAFTFAEPLFLRYSFYPLPGSTSKFVLTIGTYLDG